MRCILRILSSHSTEGNDQLKLLVADKRLVGIHIKHLAILIGDLDLGKPSIAIGIGVDRRWIVVQRIVDLGDRTADRGVEIADRLDRFDRSEGLAGLYGLPRLDIDEDDVAKFALGVLCNADGPDITFDPKPLMLLGILKLGWEIHSSILRRSISSNELAASFHKWVTQSKRV